MTREEAIIDLNALKFILDNDQYTDEIEEALDMAISALQQPERKKGRWNFVGYQMFECTKCGKSYSQSQFEQLKSLTTDPDFPNFCPNCGSYNGGEAE